MDLTSLLGDSVSPDVITQIENGLTEAIAKAVSLKESEHEQEISHLKQQANEYGDYLKEQANEYGNYLHEKANDYGSYLCEQANLYAISVASKNIHEGVVGTELQYAETINELKEQANAYGESIKQDLIEKADAYTKQFISEYKQQHEEMFEAIETEQTAKDIVESIGAVLTSFGVSHDSVDVIKGLHESIKDYKHENNLLQSQIDTMNLDKEKQVIFESMTSHLSLSEKQKVLDVSNNILTESVGHYKTVIKMLVDKHSDTTIPQNKKINEQVNNNNNLRNDVTGGIKFPTEKNNVQDITSLIY